MKRFLCGLLALCLLSCLPVSAAESQRLTLRYQQTGDGVRLTLEGLEEEIYALQLELVLEGELSRASFTPAQRDVYSPDCHLETGRNETSVTVTTEERHMGRRICHSVPRMPSPSTRPASR